MQQKKSYISLFYILFTVFVLFAFFVCAVDMRGIRREKQLPHDRAMITDWTVSVGDGEPVPMQLPAQVTAGKGEKVTIEAELPQDITSAMWLNYYTESNCNVYVDGVLRKHYDRDEIGLWGGAVKPVSLFAKLYITDAGRTVTIVFDDRSVSNRRLNAIYYGDSLGLVAGDLMHYSLIMLFSMFLTFISVVVIIGDIVASVVNRRRAELAHLSTGVLFATMWIFYGSKIFQYIASTTYVNGPLSYMSIMLVPIPIVIYVNTMQKGRYVLEHVIVVTAAVGNFVIMTILHYTGTISFLDSRNVMRAIFVVIILAELLTIGADIKNGHLKEYSIIAVGLCIAVFFGILELVQNLLNVFGNEGLFMEIGLAGVLITGFLQQLATNYNENTARQKAIAANESKSAFVAGMSHELRTPINSIIGMNEMIMRENRDPKVREYATQVDRSGKLLLGMINDVLDLSKIEAGKMNIIETPYQTVPAIIDMIRVLQERTVSKSLKSEHVISPDIPKELIGDEVHIKQILINLMSNAVKYSKEGTVTLKISCMPGHIEDSVMVRFVISDQGMGIKKEALPTLFDRFIRADEQRNRSIEGSGLGLSIVKGLVDQMDGSISVESEYGKGSTFTVLIPQKISVSEPIGNIDEAIRKSNEDYSEYVERFHAPDASILIVDDNLVNLKVATELLKRTKMQIDTATGGKECVYKCRNKRYDLILMDHRMPDPDGIETLHLIRDDFAGVNYDTKVIALTANVYAGVREMYLSEGFADYLSKPIDSELLEKSILKHLDPELIVLEEEKKEEPEEPAPVYSVQSADSVLKKALGTHSDETFVADTLNTDTHSVSNETNKQNEPAKAEEAEAAKGDANMKTLVENLRELEEMDVDKTLERYGTKPGFLKILFTAIVTDGRKKSEEMLQHLAEKDYKSFGIEAHATKSSMATIYADAISERAKAHEFACREERYDFVEEDGEAFVKDYLVFLDKVDEAIKNASD